MSRRTKAGLPSVTDLYKPLLKALINLGGSGNIGEINEKVYEITKLPEDILSIPHGDGRTKVEYRLAWARTRLKNVGLLENTSRGIWILKDTSIDPEKTNPTEINNTARNLYNTANQSISEEEKIDLLEKYSEVEGPKIKDWKEILLEKLYTIPPSSFEKLTQLLLRESGFIQVDVTGKSGDGGIDGKGIVRINGFLSFHVIFQCKRYKGSVTPSQIRDFRGAMQGRADKGLFVTTGTYTRDAIKEATRDGAPPIDLIDGELLCDKLKELKLGVETELIESVIVKTNWFDNI